MGVVYLARDDVLGRLVAVKVLSPDLASDETRLEDVRREARTLASLSHPNIATIFSLDRGDDGSPFVVLEFIEGTTLAERLARGPLGVRPALLVARQIADALEAAHAAGIVHRDLKPGNVMVTRREWVKILDFGLASAGGGGAHPRAGAAGASASSADAATMTIEATGGEGAIQGTPSYMSPEQARGEPQDARTDVFAFGAVLYECLTGAKCFDGTRLADVLARVIALDPDWARLPADTPQAIRDLLKSCMMKDREARMGDFAAIRGVIDQTLGGGASLFVRAAGRSDVPNNLPAELARFVGRAALIEEVAGAIASERLVTLTGPAGCGKSRVALRVADDQRVREACPEGIWHADLSTCEDGDRAVERVRAALGGDDAGEGGSTEAIARKIGRSAQLLILDNADHVLEPAAALVGDLLHACPELRVLATTRAPLGVSGESARAVGPMETPPEEADTPELLIAFDAAALFVARARAAKASFELNEAMCEPIGRICRTLDGIPLAIELAAARVSAISPKQLADRMGDALKMLQATSRDADPRHRTLRAALSWSYEQLEPKQRRALQRLSVFVGGWSLEAAEAIGADAEPDGDDAIEGWEMLDLLSALVERSLVQFEEGFSGEGRYSMLESMRRFAWESVSDAAERERLQRAHAAWFAEWVAEGVGAGGLDPERLTRMLAEHENLLAAIDWSERAFAAGDDAGREQLSRMLGVMPRFWMAQGFFRLGLTRIDRAIELFHADAGSAEIASMHGTAGTLARRIGDLASARTHQQAARDMWSALGERKGVTTAVSNLAMVELQSGDFDAARSHCDEALAMARDIRDARLEAINLSNLGNIAGRQGDYPRARELFEQAVEINRRAGNRPLEASNLRNLSEVALRLGDVERGTSLAEMSLAMAREVGDERVAGDALATLAGLALAHGQGDASRDWTRQCLAHRLRMGDRIGCAEMLERLPLLLDDADRANTPVLEDVARTLGAASAIRRDARVPVPPHEAESGERSRAEIERLLGPDRFASAFAHGETLAWERGVRRATSWLAGRSGTHAATIMRTTGGLTLPGRPSRN
jgi:non-specific serine/threonine protein kinase